jgi:hypothetical protein
MESDRKHCQVNKGLYCEDECLLIGQFQSQATKGGGSSDELIKSGDIPGPYWSKGNWEGLTKNNLDMASAFNCACKEELATVIKETTTLKIEKGEIVDKK